MTEHERGTDRLGRRAKRFLTPLQTYEIWLQLVQISEFRLGLEQRELAYVVQMPGTLCAYPEDVTPDQVPYVGRGRPPVARYRQQRSSLQQVLAAGAQAAQAVAWREGADGEELVSRFVALRVRPAGVRLRRATRGGQLPVRWLVAEWPDGEPEPVK